MKSYIVPGADVLDTVTMINNIIEEQKIKPEIRAKALKLIQGIPEDDQMGEIKRLFEYVRKNIRFTRDVQGIETLQYPENTMKWGGGDCDCKVILLGSLLSAIGHKIRYSIYKITNPVKFDHINLQVFLRKRNKWLTLDPTKKSKPFGWKPDNFFDQRIIDFKKGGLI